MRVDGKGGDTAEVFAAGNFLGRDAGVEAFGGALHALRIFVRQAVFGENGVHLRLIVARAAEHVNHLAHRTFRAFGPVGDFHHGLVAVLRRAEIFFGDEDIGGEGAAFGHEEAVTALHLHGADKLIVGALDDFRHLRLAGMSLAACQHCDAHAVAVECAERIALAHEYALAAVVGHEGVAPVALAAERALHHVRAGGGGVASLAVGGEIVIEHEFLQGVHHEHLCGVVLCFEYRKEVFHLKSCPGVAFKQFEQLLQGRFLGQARSLLFVLFCHKTDIKRFSYVQSNDILGKGACN